VAGLALALTVVAPAAAAPGATATLAPIGTGYYLVTLTNVGPGTISGFVVSMGAEPTNIAPSRTCVDLPDAGEIWCTLTLAPGASTQMCYSGRPLQELVALFVGGVRETVASIGTSPAVALCPFASFNVGSPSTGGVRRCVIPRLKGKKLPVARRAIERAQCSIGKVRRVHSSRVKKGRVISQSPPAGRSRSGGTKVSLIVSAGK
jgi:hypothetical protein